MSKSRTNLASGYVQSALAKYATLFLAALAFHVVGTWSVPLIDRDEPRFAEASREMIERGDYVVPYFNNQLRLDKPPLAYWAQVASYRIFGQNDFAARFPSAVAAALVALSILAWGSRLGGDRVGWWAAIIFTLSLQTFVHAKAAVADMWLVLFVTLAHWSGYELLRDCLTINDGKHRTPNPPSQGYGAAGAQLPTSNSEEADQSLSFWWLIFYLSLAFGFLAKGPIGWMPLLTVAVLKLFLRGIEFSRRFKFLLGILIMLAIVALWGIPALMRTHGEFFFVGIGRHVIGRSLGAMEGHGANSLGAYLLLLPFYFVTVFVSFFPWSIKLPSLTRKLWRTRDKIDIYLMSGTAVIVIIFSLIKTKLPHYTLPAFPLLALLLARLCSRQANSAASKLDGFKPSSFERLTGAVAFAYLASALAIPPLVAHSFPAYSLFQTSRDSLRPEMEFGAVDFQEPSLVWYFRSRTHRFLTPLNKTNAADFMTRTGPRFVILPTQLVPEIFPALQSKWTTFSTNGVNIAKGKHVDLTLVLKPE